MNATPFTASRFRQRGFSLITAIFLLVILAMLGAFMITLSTTQNVTAAQDFQGSQAFRAARAGIEWAATRICNGAGVANPDYPASTSCPTLPLTACPAASTSMAVGNYTVTVACIMNADASGATIYDEGGTSRYIFWITSTAITGASVGSIGYIERSVNAFVEF